MTNREQLKKELNNYSKDELIDALLISPMATGFILTKCKQLYGSKPKQDKKPVVKKEAPADAK